MGWSLSILTRCYVQARVFASRTRSQSVSTHVSPRKTRKQKTPRPATTMRGRTLYGGVNSSPPSSARNASTKATAVVVAMTCCYMALLLSPLVDGMFTRRRNSKEGMSRLILLSRFANICAFDFYFFTYYVYGIFIQTFRVPYP